MERLDKIIASQGTLSRRDAHKLIKSKSVKVDGSVVVKVDFKVDPEKSVIEVNGQALDFKEHIYIMMNKPAGVLSATKDNSQKTVLDLLPDNLRRKGLFPVGRLDKDTEGLLIISDDGEFAHKLLSPGNHVYKRYFAKLDKELGEEMVLNFKNGIEFKDGTKCLPAKLELLGGSRCLVTVMEGKYHQVKRMFAARGKHVTALHREQIGALRLDSALQPGQYRELIPEELELVFSETGNRENDGESG